MGHDFWFRGRLKFRDREAAIAAIRRELAEASRDANDDNPVQEEWFVWHGRVATIDMRGMMPYTMSIVGSAVIGVYASHAVAGEIIVLNVQDGYGESRMAGGDSYDLSEREIKRLTKEHDGLYSPLYLPLRVFWRTMITPRIRRLLSR